MSRRLPLSACLAPLLATLTACVTLGYDEAAVPDSDASMTATGSAERQADAGVRDIRDSGAGEDARDADEAASGDVTNTARVEDAGLKDAGTRKPGDSATPATDATDAATDAGPGTPPPIECGKLLCPRHSDPCWETVCEPPAGCGARPRANGTPCGSGQCGGGICKVPAIGCGGSSCQRECPAGAQQCEFSCGAGQNCSANCDEGQRCDIACDDSAVCTAECTGEGTACALDCGSSTNCHARCSSGTSCLIDCRDSEHCNSIQCDGTSECLVLCDDDDCPITGCPDELFKECDEGVSVCGRDCP